MKRTMLVLGLLGVLVAVASTTAEATTATLRFFNCAVVGAVDPHPHYKDTSLLRINYYYGDVVGFMKTNLFENDGWNVTPFVAAPAGQTIQVNSVSLKLHTAGKYGSTTYFITGLYPTSDGWENTTIFYDNKPDATGPAVLTWTYPNPSTTFTPPMASDALKAYVQQEVNGDGVLSFRMEDVNGTSADGQELWYPKYSELTVDYSYVPEPVTMVLLGLGGLFGFLRRK